jgi:putative ABC transport system permease protein
MPYAYAATLTEGAPANEGDYRVPPDDSMTWGFFFGSTEKEPNKRTMDNSLFAFVIEPPKLRTMMDELDSLSDADAKPLTDAIEKMQSSRQGIIVGADLLKKLGARVGDRITLYGRNYRDITFEVEIAGVFPETVSRYRSSAALNREYFNSTMDAYAAAHGGKAHPQASKTLNLVWLRLPDREIFQKVANQILTSPSYTDPAVKCETASSGVATFLEAYRDLIWGVRWLLAPACVFTLALVISNAISISVRERQTEFAVLKVLGFRPNQILVMVMLEALLIGLPSGLLSAGATYGLINWYFGGLNFPIAFFPRFMVPAAAWWWGAAMGAGTAFAGSMIPAWNARRVKVSEVFSRVA